MVKRLKPPHYAQLTMFSVGQDIKTGLAEIRGKPRGLVKCVVTEEGRRLCIRLW